MSISEIIVSAVGGIIVLMIAIIGFFTKSQLNEIQKMFKDARDARKELWEEVNGLRERLKGVEVEITFLKNGKKKE